MSAGEDSAASGAADNGDAAFPSFDDIPALPVLWQIYLPWESFQPNHPLLFVLELCRSALTELLPAVKRVPEMTKPAFEVSNLRPVACAKSFRSRARKKPDAPPDYPTGVPTVHVGLASCIRTLDFPYTLLSPELQQLFAIRPLVVVRLLELAVHAHSTLPPEAVVFSVTISPPCAREAVGSPSSAIPLVASHQALVCSSAAVVVADLHVVSVLQPTAVATRVTFACVTCGARACTPAPLGRVGAPPKCRKRRCAQMGSAVVTAAAAAATASAKGGALAISEGAGSGGNAGQMVPRLEDSRTEDSQVVVVKIGGGATATGGGSASSLTTAVVPPALINRLAVGMRVRGFCVRATTDAKGAGGKAGALAVGWSAGACLGVAPPAAGGGEGGAGRLEVLAVLVGLSGEKPFTVGAQVQPPQLLPFECEGLDAEPETGGAVGTQSEVSAAGVGGRRKLRAVTAASSYTAACSMAFTPPLSQVVQGGGGGIGTTFTQGDGVYTQLVSPTPFDGGGGSALRGPVPQGTPVCLSVASTAVPATAASAAAVGGSAASPRPFTLATPPATTSCFSAAQLLPSPPTWPHDLLVTLLSLPAAFRALKACRATAVGRALAPLMLNADSSVRACALAVVAGTPHPSAFRPPRTVCGGAVSLCSDCAARAALADACDRRGGLCVGLVGSAGQGKTTATSTFGAVGLRAAHAVTVAAPTVGYSGSLSVSTGSAMPPALDALLDPPPPPLTSSLTPDAVSAAILTSGCDVVSLDNAHIVPAAAAAAVVQTPLTRAAARVSSEAFPPRDVSVVFSVAHDASATKPSSASALTALAGCVDVAVPLTRTGAASAAAVARVFAEDGSTSLQDLAASSILQVQEGVPPRPLAAPSRLGAVTLPPPSSLVTVRTFDLTCAAPPLARHRAHAALRAATASGLPLALSSILPGLDDRPVDGGPSPGGASPSASPAGILVGGGTVGRGGVPLLEPPIAHAYVTLARLWCPVGLTPAAAQLIAAVYVNTRRASAPPPPDGPELDAGTARRAPTAGDRFSSAAQPLRVAVSDVLASAKDVWKRAKSIAQGSVFLSTCAHAHTCTVFGSAVCGGLCSDDVDMPPWALKDSSSGTADGGDVPPALSPTLWGDVSIPPLAAANGGRPTPALLRSLTRIAMAFAKLDFCAYIGVRHVVEACTVLLGCSYDDLTQGRVVAQGQQRTLSLLPREARALLQSAGTFAVMAAAVKSEAALGSGGLSYENQELLPVVKSEAGGPKRAAIGDRALSAKAVRNLIHDALLAHAREVQGSLSDNQIERIVRQLGVRLPQNTTLSAMLQQMNEAGYLLKDRQGGWRPVKNV